MILPHVLYVEPAPDVLCPSILLIADVGLAEVVVEVPLLRQLEVVELHEAVHVGVWINSLLGELVQVLLAFDVFGESRPSVGELLLPVLSASRPVILVQLHQRVQTAVEKAHRVLEVEVVEAELYELLRVASYDAEPLALKGVGFLDDEVGVVALHVVAEDGYLHVLVVEVEVAVLVSRSPVSPAQVAVVPHPVGAQTLVAEAAVLRPSEVLPVVGAHDDVDVESQQGVYLLLGPLELLVEVGYGALAPEQHRLEVEARNGADHLEAEAHHLVFGQLYGLALLLHRHLLRHSFEVQVDDEGHLELMIHVLESHLVIHARRGQFHT